MGHACSEQAGQRPVRKPDSPPPVEVADVAKQQFYLAGVKLGRTTPMSSSTRGTSRTVDCSPQQRGSPAAARDDT